MSSGTLASASIIGTRKRKAAVASASFLAAKKATVISSPSKPSKVAGPQCAFSFLPMGQGDCTVFRTPSNRVVVIDCGAKPIQRANPAHTTAQYYQHIRGMLNPFFANIANPVIDKLLISHSDADHHNVISGAFGIAPLVTVNEVWHSSPITDARFQNGNTRTWLRGNVPGGPAQIRQVMLVNTNPQTRQALPGSPWVAIPGASLVQLTPPPASPAFRILSEPNFTLDILVSGLPRPPLPPVGIDYTLGGTLDDHDAGNNRACMVCLITTFGQRILICADATIITEQYLTQHFSGPNGIDNLTIVQIPHHGSAVTSFGHPTFINQVNAQFAVASAGLNQHVHHLPSFEVLNAYAAQALPKPPLMPPQLEGWRKRNLPMVPVTAIFTNYTSVRTHQKYRYVRVDATRNVYVTGVQGFRQYIVDAAGIH